MSTDDKRNLSALPLELTEDECRRLVERLTWAERLLVRWEGGQLHSDALYQETKVFLNG